jgi:ABC-2 type transport system permease protein
MLDTVRKAGVDRSATEMEIGLTGMAHGPAADLFIQIEQARLSGNLRAWLGWHKATRRGRGNRCLLIARALTQEASGSDRDDFGQIRLRTRRILRRAHGGRRPVLGNRGRHALWRWPLDRFGLGLWRRLCFAIIGLDRRRPRFQAEPMGFADHGIAANAAEIFSDLACGQAAFPHGSQAIDPLVGPGHCHSNNVICGDDGASTKAACRAIAFALVENAMTIQNKSNVAVAVPQGPAPERIIRTVNWIGLKTLYQKEVRRFMKVHLQTIWAPSITTLLFLVIFTVALGRDGVKVLGVPFADFIAPGLIIMGMMQNAFANSSFALLAGKLQGTIVDYLMPPLSNAELLVAMVGGAMTRAFAVGLVIWAAMLLWPGVHVSPAHPLIVLWFGFLGSMMVAFMGVLTSIWAEKFDHASVVTNFVIAPLSLLSGTFYSIDRLAPSFQAISHANPFFYVISGFRYGFIDRADSNILLGSTVLVAINIGLGLGTYFLLRSGWKLKN